MGSLNINADAIPQELRATDQWLVWRREVRSDKPTKVPYDSRSRRPGSVTDPAIYLPFDRAVAIASDDQFYEGIGFAVTAADPYVGVDLDNCLDDQSNLSPWAVPVVEALDSYTEITPSGKGLRVWIRGELPAGRRRRGKLGGDGTGGIEFYDRERYFTVTGRRLSGSPATVEERAVALVDVHRTIFPEKTAEPAKRPDPGPIRLEDREILDRMFRARNGDSVRALFDGDLGRHASGSEADLALCSHLAFWTGGDVDSIDRLFRQNALFDAKWEDRADYREATIAKALERSTFYDPSYRTQNAAAQAPAATPAGPDGPGDARPDDGGDGEPGPDDEHRTDLGNARRLVAMFGRDLRHCHPWKSWLAWMGDRWKVDETGLVFRKARAVVARLHLDATGIADGNRKKAAKAWALKSEGESRLNAMVSVARHEEGMPVMPDAFDAPAWLLNCPNGTVDLKTGRLRAHDRLDLLTKRTNVAFNPDALCPTWEAFLIRVMGGDMEMVAFLRRAIGYALTGDINEHVLFFLYGLGRNGKSTFLNTILEILGDYGITINADLLTVKPGDDHPTGLADLQARRFVATIEVEDGRRLAESLVKTITGGDNIRARRMRQDFFEFPPTHKLFLAANHKPVVRGTDEGIWRRIRLIPFKVQIPDDQVDRNLPAKLKAEAPGILAWAVRGCLEWQTHGLREPSIVTEATRDYRAEMDILAEFLDECCEMHPGSRCRGPELYKVYSAWCRDSGANPYSANKFARMLTDRGIQSEKSHGTNWKIGIELKEEHLPGY